MASVDGLGDSKTTFLALFSPGEPTPHKTENFFKNSFSGWLNIFYCTVRGRIQNFPFCNANEFFKNRTFLRDN
jgi:hypothetical protein